MRKLRKGERYALFSNTKDNPLEGQESFNIKEVPNTRRLKESLVTKLNGKKELERKHKRGICKPKYGVSNCVSRTYNPKSGIRKYECGIYEPKYTVSNCVSRTRNPKSGIRKHRCGIYEPKYSVSNCVSRAYNPKSGIRKHECGIYEPKYGVSNCVSRTRNPKSGISKHKCGICKPKYAISNCVSHTCKRVSRICSWNSVVSNRKSGIWVLKNVASKPRCRKSKHKHGIREHVSGIRNCELHKSKREPRIRNRENAILSVAPALSVSQSISPFIRPISYISWGRLRLDFGRAMFLTEAGPKPEDYQQQKMQKTSKRRVEERQKKVRTTCVKNAVDLRSLYQKATVSIRVTYQKYTLDLLKTYQRLTKKLPIRYQEVGNKLVALYRNASDNLHAFGSLTVASLRRNGMLLSKGSAIFSTFLLYFVVLFSDAQAQSAGERAADGSPTEYQGRVLSDAAFTPIEGAKIERLANKTRELVFSDTEGYFVIPPHWGDDSIRVSFHSFGAVTKALYDGKLIRGKSTVFLKKDTSFIDKPFLGDSIPDSIWDLPLQVVNEKSGRRIVTLREYQHKDLIVLDFWATWCSPCVKALDHLNELQQDYGQQLMVLPVHNSNHTTVAAFIKNRGWDMPCVVGENYFILQSHFFKRPVVGNPIFIYKGRYLACPSVRGYDDAAIRGILEGRPVDIVNRFEATHMEGLEGRR